MNDREDDDSLRRDLIDDTVRADDPFPQVLILPVRHLPAHTREAGEVAGSFDGICRARVAAYVGESVET